MAHTETRICRNPRKDRFLGFLQESTATVIAAFRMWRRTAARHREIEGLTLDQLRDIGHPRIGTPTPTLDVKAGLITNLMSMR